MKQILRAFLFLLLFTATVNTAIADEKANVTKQGTVRGRIIDATKQTLPGASIYIEKLHTGVTSDVNGFYTFSNLDPGTLYSKGELRGLLSRRTENHHPRRPYTGKRRRTERRRGVAGSGGRRRLPGTAPCHQLTEKQHGDYECSLCRPGRQVPRLQHR